jgi:hypothetical protein
METQSSNILERRCSRERESRLAPLVGACYPYYCWLLHCSWSIHQSRAIGASRSEASDIIYCSKPAIIRRGGTPFITQTPDTVKPLEAHS